MELPQSKITILICLVISVIIVFFGFKAKESPVKDVSVPPAVPIAQASEAITIGSPDGKMSLTVKQQREGEMSTFTFTLKDEATGVWKEIFTKTVPSGVNMSIPDNTFSSDNKYVFLKEEGSDTTSYIVITPSGILDTSGMFEAKYEDFVITDVTGWAGPTLLVINTDKKEGGKGPSFWLDVASKSFIRLSTRFD